MACREKVEDVYWAHRLWPAENQTPKPPREAVMPRSAVARLVEESLRYEAALAAVWNRPLTPEVIQAEIDREARRSRDPAMLHALWETLGNDPSLVAECLVRPEMAARRLEEWYANDRSLHAATRRRAENEVAAARAGTGIEALRAGSGTVTETVWAEQQGGLDRRLEPGVVALPREEWQRFNEVLLDAFPAASSASGPAAVRGIAGQVRRGLLPPPALLHPARRTIADLPVEKLSPLREERERFSIVLLRERSAGRVRVVTVAWPKELFGEWWKGKRESFAAQVPAAGAYHLDATRAGGCDQDTWTVPSGLDLPTGRTLHTAVWTGSEMIVWGGSTEASSVSSGGRYSPATDSWEAMSTVGAPSPRQAHTAVWTGSEMIVWGGGVDSGAPGMPIALNDGARYAPGTDSWVPVNPTAAPEARAAHTAIWTGSEMVVWGGQGNDSLLSSGGRYSPATDRWAATSAVGAPAARFGHTAVWTGAEMIVWGGVDAFVFGTALNDGARYLPVTDSWVPVSLTGTPASRLFHTAAWTGSEMIVWGGTDGTSGLDSGGRYAPATDTWAATSTAGVPLGRIDNTAVWTGSEMIVWGGTDFTDTFNSGGRYTPATDSWAATTLIGAPDARVAATAVWTGSEMIVWGGDLDTTEVLVNFGSGGRYSPATDSWVATNPALPEPRENHVAVWTGSEMIVWGGQGAADALSSGARYTPATDSWTATSTTGAPAPQTNPTAVWTGSEMIVWEGTDTTGGRYSPATDSWVATSTAGAPAVRHYFTMVWTGSEVIVWGGDDGGGNTGGRYRPATDSWTATSTVGAPAARWYHSAVWTGSEMIVWGGTDNFDFFASGGRYTPATDSWVATSLVSAPPGRYDCPAVWTGSEMIVWGGDDGKDAGHPVAGGGRYQPATDSWVATSTTDAPVARMSHTLVWTGREMIVWGGWDGEAGVNSGGRYTPANDSWSVTSATGAPEARQGHTAVWTAAGMIVWGGINAPLPFGEIFANGGIYCAAGGDPPVAGAQSLVVSENGALAIMLTATQAAGDPLSYSIVSDPSHGALSGTAPAITYTPAAGYFGSDSFTFEASDGLIDSNVATVTLRVDAPPVAGGQSLTVRKNALLPVTLTATDPDGDSLTFTIVGNPSHGTLSGAPPLMTYAPAAGYVGPDGFTFQANDGRLDSNVAPVAITVEPTGALFYTVPPCRLFDSRTSAGPLLSAVENVIQVAGHCGVPTTASALAANVTIVAPSAAGLLQLYAAAGQQPGTSVVNFSSGQVRANSSVVQLSLESTFVARLTLVGSGTANLIVDVAGYFQ